MTAPLHYRPKPQDQLKTDKEMLAALFRGSGRLPVMLSPAESPAARLTEERGRDGLASPVTGGLTYYEKRSVFASCLARQPQPKPPMIGSERVLSVSWGMDI